MKEYDVAVIGGDRRLACMKQFLRQQGLRVITYAVTEEQKEDTTIAGSLREAVRSADAVVCGIPLLKGNGLNTAVPKPDLTLPEFTQCLLNCAGETTPPVLFAGVIPAELKKQCAEAGIPCHDFMEEETLAIANAVATAEGAIAEAVINSEKNIHGSKSLVLGYGRCGKVLCDKLKGLSADVTVASHCGEEIAYAQAFGVKTLPLALLEKEIHQFEYVYNTIPATVLGKEVLKSMQRDVLVIDIASAPGGVDTGAAKELEIHALHCLGLPGRYAPAESGRNMAQYLIKKLN